MDTLYRREWTELVTYIYNRFTSVLCHVSTSVTCCKYECCVDIGSCSGQVLQCVQLCFHQAVWYKTIQCSLSLPLSFILSQFHKQSTGTSTRFCPRLLSQPQAIFKQLQTEPQNTKHSSPTKASSIVR